MITGPLSARIFVGDVRERLRSLPDQSVQCVVTSPPYWGLRDYGTEGQIGLERSPIEYVSALCDVFGEVWRVLRDDGCVWLNLGDSYNGNGTVGRKDTRECDLRSGRTAPHTPFSRADVIGLKPKDLVGIPWRVAFALQAQGWYLRSDIIWSKPNPMPESVTDRPTKAHEYIFLLTKSARYYYDAEAVAEDGKDWSKHKPGVGIKETFHYGAGNGGNAGLKGIAQRYRGGACPDCNGGLIGKDGSGLCSFGAGPCSHKQCHPNAVVCPTCNGTGIEPAPATRNKRSVWHVATQPYPEAHFATYPEALIKPCILAGTSEKGQCPRCGAPWVRVLDAGEVVRVREGSDTSGDAALVAAKGRHGSNSIFTTGEKRIKGTVGWQPSCPCNAGEPVPQIVLDPFCGSGTTGVVALRHGRHFIGVELNTEYARLAEKRIIDDGPLFNYVTVE